MKIKKGTVDFISYFNLVDSAAGTPETALTIANIDATYTRAQAAAVKNDLTALAATTTAHTDNKGIEVDATNAPGLYRVDWPDAAFASGADKVILTVTCPGCAPAHLIVELVDYEPADVQAILGALTTSASAGDPGTTTTLTAYLKQIINTLEGTAGIPTFPAAAVAANNVSLAEAIRQLTTIITSTRAGYLDALNIIGAVSSAADVSAVLAAVANVDNIWGASQTTDATVNAINGDMATVLTRLSAARAGYMDNLSAGAVAQASALATVAGYLDTEIAAILAAVDTEVAAIKAKTDGLPADPADASDIQSAFATVNSTLSTISTLANTAASNTTTLLTNLATLAGKFTGITLLARWLGALMGKTADATTLTEIQGTQAGAGYNNATDSLEAQTDVSIPAIAVAVQASIDNNGVQITDGAISSSSFTVGAVDGVETGILEQIVQLWRRFFKRTTKSSTQIKTYADNGTTVLTTQTYTSVDPDDDVGAAS